ncbi:VOC family protein [Yoonia sp. R2-816]|uniref:VOC family protein n=1 Tax=Yoonia sp. R2-816 TaxID=3342638 RepID=UPI003727B6C6
MTRLIDLTPLAPVTDVPAATAFFQDVLGFELVAAFDGFAYLRRDGATIRLIMARGDMNDAARQQGYYIDVEDVDALHETLLPALSKLPETHHQPPADTSYGQREFVVVYEALMLVFGQPIPKEPS